MKPKQLEELRATVALIEKFSDADLMKLLHYGKPHAQVAAYEVWRHRQPKRRGRPVDIAIDMDRLCDRGKTGTGKVRSRRSYWNEYHESRAFNAYGKRLEHFPPTVRYALGVYCMDNGRPSKLTTALVVRAEKLLKRGCTARYVVQDLREPSRHRHSTPVVGAGQAGADQHALAVASGLAAVWGRCRPCPHHRRAAVALEGELHVHQASLCTCSINASSL